MHVAEPNLARIDRTVAEIDLAAVAANLETVRRLGGVADVMAVVKADAYGHGLIPVAHTLQDTVTFIGVAHVGEARKLAADGIRTRIYLLGPTVPDEREEIVVHRWTACLSSIEEAEHLNRLNAVTGNPPLPVHLAVDTGMGRGGILPEKIPEILAGLAQLEHLEVEGIGSHLPSADEDEDFTHGQFETFATCCAAKDFRFRHLSNSAGLLGYPQGVCNLTRPGLALYGVAPLPAFQSQLQPTLTLKSVVSLVRDLPAGHGVSYGRDCILPASTRVATVGIGYGDGLPRHLSGNNADVLIRGRRCPLLGRVTMDQIMVDVSGGESAVAPGDEVVVIGSQGDAEIPVTEVAEKAGTIPWEIFTSITSRVPRIYRREQEGLRK